MNIAAETGCFEQTINNPPPNDKGRKKIKIKYQQYSLNGQIDCE